MTTEIDDDENGVRATTMTRLLPDGGKMIQLVLLRTHASGERLKISQSSFFWSLYYNQDINSPSRVNFVLSGAYRLLVQCDPVVQYDLPFAHIRPRTANSTELQHRERATAASCKHGQIAFGGPMKWLLRASYI